MGWEPIFQQLPIWAGAEQTEAHIRRRIGIGKPASFAGVTPKRDFIFVHFHPKFNFVWWKSPNGEYVWIATDDEADGDDYDAAAHIIPIDNPDQVRTLWDINKAEVDVKPIVDYRFGLAFQTMVCMQDLRDRAGDSDDY